MSERNKKAALKIVDVLRKNGFAGLFAGGCVRDMLLGRPAKDYDVVTDAKPEEVTKLFRRTIQIGAKFGVVMIMKGKEQVEVATFRTESGYADGRHPAKVEYSNAKADAERRDFTINGMFFDPVSEEVMDYVGGKDDLKIKMLRTIGSADERFAEDYLRMLRAVRFSTELGFEIEADTWQAVCKNAANITKISGERVAMELVRILAADDRSRGAKLLVDSGLSLAVFPEFSGEGVDLGIKVLAGLEGDVGFSLGLAGLFAGFDVDFAAKSTRILNLSNSDERDLRFLLDSRGKLLEADMGLADLKLVMGQECFDDLCKLQKSIQRAKGLSCDEFERLMERVEGLKGVDVRPKPLLDGHELMKLGADPGPVVGKIGDAMYRAQLGEEIATKKQARQWAAKWLCEYKKQQ
ncbi:MAG TPA: CCA tRNA nucleotidyltransferase [Phycisphaerales bacterium]|nr:CCA tRNA nucleotidyltransferase [Phycisphaerales bacterium]